MGRWAGDGKKYEMMNLQMFGCTDEQIKKWMDFSK